MMDVERVCCMCGDVGFPDQIFRCINCHHRFQHSYCRNYYSESPNPPELCDWCHTEADRTANNRGGSTSLKKSNSKTNTGVPKIKREEGSGTGKGKSSSWSSSGAPSPKTSTRRYKLLKDVMC